MTSNPRFSDQAGPTMAKLSNAELRRRQDSLMENIGALRFSIARIEYLTDYLRLACELLGDCRPLLQAHGHTALDKRIERLLTETQDDIKEPKSC